MPDSTYSVKVNEETQEKLRMLVETSGLNNKDFFTNLISVYELQRAKEKTSILTADIEELEALTRRINAIFINTSERIHTIDFENKEQLKQVQENSNGTIQLQQQRIETLLRTQLEHEEEFRKSVEELDGAEQSIIELQKRLRELEGTIADKKILIEEYQSKNDTLTSIVNSYKSASEENQILKLENASLAEQVKEMGRDIEILNEKLEERAIKHNEGLERQKELLSIEYEKKILELKTEHQQQIQKQQEVYNDKVQFLLQRLEDS